MTRKTIILAPVILLVGLAACNPMATDDSNTKIPVNLTASNSISDATFSPVGTPEAVQGKWQTLSSGNEVLDISAYGNEVWAATTGGVVRWNMEDRSSMLYTTLDGLASNTVREIVRDSWGNIWAASSVDGVNCFNGNTWQRNVTDQEWQVAYYAEGYDIKGNRVCGTLDAGPILGLLAFDFSAESSRDFTLHLNWVEDVALIKITANTYDPVTPLP